LQTEQVSWWVHIYIKVKLQKLTAFKIPHFPKISRTSLYWYLASHPDTMEGLGDVSWSQPQPLPGSTQQCKTQKVNKNKNTL
jgi:hypothetical protein